MKKINSVSHSKNIAWKKIEDEAVILNLDTGLYYSLDLVSTRIWELFKEKKNKDDVINQLVEEYEVEEKRLKKDIDNFITDLNKEKLVKVS